MTSGVRAPEPLRSRPYRRFNPRLPRGRRPLRSRPFPFPFRFVSFQPTPSGGGEGDRASASRQTAPRARQEPARSPYRARTGPLARVVARAPTSIPDRTAFRASASRQTAPRTRQKPPEARSAPEAGQTPARSPHRARAHPPGAYGGARPDRRTSPHRRYAPDAAQNAPRASRKRLPHATSLQHDHRPGPDSTATPGHCVTATVRAPVAPDDAGAQRRSSVAVAPPGHIVCTQVSCESASPFSFTSTQADTDAARPAFTP